MGTKSAIDVLQDKDRGDLDLDMAFWAEISGHGVPVPHYAEPWFWQARNEGDPSTTATTSLNSALKRLGEAFPDARLQLVLEGGDLQILVAGEKDGFAFHEEHRQPEAGFDDAVWALQLTRLTTIIQEQEYRHTYPDTSGPEIG